MNKENLRWYLIGVLTENLKPKARNDRELITVLNVILKQLKINAFTKEDFDELYESVSKLPNVNINQIKIKRQEEDVGYIG